MAVDFRCEKCGKLLSVEAGPASKVKCPYCKSKVQVPAALASLPRPQVPDGTTTAAVAAAVQGADQVVYEQPDALMELMAKLMPWIISLFCHVGILVIMAFISIVVLKPAVGKEDVIPPEVLTDTPGNALRTGGGSTAELAGRSSARNENAWTPSASPIPVTANMGGPTPDATNRMTLIGVAGGGSGGGISGGGGGGGAGPTAAFGIAGGGGGATGRVSFMGVKSTGMAYYVIYLVDRSGSMLDTFDDVRNELRRSISQLTPQQSFHVIFFSDGPPLENPPKRLVKADDKSKEEALKYLKTIQPQGKTDPIPAIKRAFEVLAQAQGKKGKLIFLLTDGDFPNNDLVLREIKALNAGKSVHINTILHRFEPESAKRVLMQIAEENGGKYKFVGVNE